MTTQTRDNLGHVINEWQSTAGREGLRGLRGSLDERRNTPGVPGKPRAGAEIRRVRCRHCKVEPVVLEVKDSTVGFSVCHISDQLCDLSACWERTCGKCSVDCPETKLEDKEERIGN